MVQVRMESNLLGANDLLARNNRRDFAQRRLLVINLMSSPGSGKTTILEKTIKNLNGKLNLGVIEEIFIPTGMPGGSSKKG
jgi:hydrogenase nickel incorporation protein HypB